MFDFPYGMHWALVVFRRSDDSLNMQWFLCIQHTMRLLTRQSTLNMLMVMLLCCCCIFVVRRFVVVQHGLEERRTPGNTLAVQPDKPYQGLSMFGTGAACVHVSNACSCVGVGSVSCPEASSLSKFGSGLSVLRVPAFSPPSCSLARPYQHTSHIITRNHRFPVAF